MLTLIKRYENYLLYDLGVAPSSAVRYVIGVKKFIKYLNGSRRKLKEDVLLNAKSLDIQNFFRYLYDKNVKKNTRQGYIKSGIKHFYNFAEDKKLISEPVIFKGNLRKTKEEKNQIKYYLKDKHIRIIKDYIENEPLPTNLNKLYIQLERHTLIEFLIETGARISELISLKYTDIHEKYILIHGKKTAEQDNNGFRAFPLRESKANSLQQLKAYYIYVYSRPPEKIFNITKRGALGYIKKLGEQAGISFPLYPHIFRHYKISSLMQLLDERGGRRFSIKEVSQLVGAHPYTLQVYYDHPDEDKIQEKYQKCYLEH